MSDNNQKFASSAILMGGSGGDHLNAQQINVLQKQMHEKLLNIFKDVDLRKWAVDQACGIAGAEIEAEGERQDVLKLARAIHAFLTEGAVETTK